MKRNKKEESESAVLTSKPKIVRVLGKVFFIVFFLAVGYLLITGVALVIPIVLSYAVRMFGYTLETPGEIFLGGATGLFILAWLFVLTFVIVRWLWRVFSKQIKKLDE